jgi:mannosylglycerate hydrolase
MPGHIVHLIPHTHWDREWYLTRAGFVARLVPMMDDLLDRLEAEPGFRSFLLDGQTVLLEDYLRVRPEHRNRIVALVRAGRLQVGPWYVLADELIPSGESLVRNLLAGTADAERLGGRLDVLYSPDAFGHPAVLPALAAEFGIRFAVLWRGYGGEPGQARDLFRWQAPDGRPIVVYHLPPDGYEVGAALPDGWDALRAVLVGRAATPHLGVMVGADHHAAHRALLDARQAIARSTPDAAVLVSRLDEFLAQAAAALDDAPAVEGELRWSYGYTWTLQGVHGSRARLKRRHALAELALERTAEPLAALAAARGRGEFRPLLAEAWRTLLRSQFHDSIAGCTADAVAVRVEARIEDVATLAAETARRAFDALTGNDPDRARERPEETTPALVVWNPAARRRGGVAIADLTWLRRDVLVGPPGSRTPRAGSSPSAAELAAAVGGLPFQPLGRASGSERLDAPHHYPDQDDVEITRVAVALPPVGGLAFLHAGNMAAGEAPVTGGVRLDGARLDNGLVRAEAGLDGMVTLTDLRTGSEFGGLFALVSEGDVGDTYTYAAPAGNRARGPSGPAEIVSLAAGPLVGSFAVQTRLYAGRSPAGSGEGRVDVRMIISLHAGSRALRCTVELDNRAHDHRLRLRLPGAAPGGAAVAGGPFGPVSRGAVAADPTRYPRETPVATAPAHRFVAPSAGAAGLAVLAPGFLEYEHTADGDLLVTLFRAIGALSRNDLATRPGHAAWPAPTPLAQSPGADRLQLAVVPLDGGGADAASLPAEWEDAFLPLRPVWLRQATPLSLPEGELTLEGAGLVLSAIKPAEDGTGIVLRCYNASADTVRGCWRLPFVASSALRVRADERQPEPAPLEPGGRAVRFIAGPRAIVTLHLK